MYIFDFDGTIVDCWERYYRVFIYLNRIDESLLDIDKYKEYKLKLLDDKIIAKEIGKSIEPDYFLNKRKLLEDMEYLKYDTLLIDSKILLQHFKNNKSIILSKRNNRDTFVLQMNRLGLQKILNNTDIIGSDVKKFEYFERKYFEKTNYIFGDSKEEYDFSDQKTNEVYIVRTGLYDSYKFPAKDNVHIINSINEIIY